MTKGLAVVAILLLSGCASANSSPPATLPSEAFSVDVTYLVTGTADSVDITIQTPTGTSQQSNVDVPMTSGKSGKPGLTFTFSPGSFVYISAQNQGGSGSVTCQITGSHGKVISTSTSSGAYVIASCSGKAS